MSMQPRTVYYEVAPLPPLINPGSPITAPGVPPYGVVWCVTGVAHLLVWITAAATSWMAAQHAMDMVLFENLSLLALVSIILTFVCAAVGALGSSSRAPGVQVAGTSCRTTSSYFRTLILLPTPRPISGRLVQLPTPRPTSHTSSYFPHLVLLPTPLTASHTSSHPLAPRPVQISDAEKAELASLYEQAREPSH